MKKKVKEVEKDDLPMTGRYCPDCGEQVLRLIETTEPAGDEYKEVCTCDRCENIVYIIRKE